MNEQPINTDQAFEDYERSVLGAFKAKAVLEIIRLLTSYTMYVDDKAIEIHIEDDFERGLQAAKSIIDRITVADIHPSS